VGVQTGFGGNPRFHTRRDALRAGLAQYRMRHVGKHARVTVEHRTDVLAGLHLGHDHRVDLAVDLAPVLVGRVVDAEIDRVGAEAVDHAQRERIDQAEHDLGFADFRQAAFAGVAAELDPAAHHYQASGRLPGRVGIPARTYHAVATFVFGPVQRLVGLVDQHLQRGGISAPLADPRAEVEAER